MLQGVSLWAPYGYHIYSVSSPSKRILQDCRISDFYKRCIHVDNTLTIMQDVTTEKTFLETLNNSHPSFWFTMELGRVKQQTTTCWYANINKMLPTRDKGLLH